MPETSLERGRATRERLLRAAVTLIGEAGWNGVTTRLVAERAGVAPGVVHYHFGSVTELLTAASLGFVHELIGQIGEELTRLPDPEAGLDWLMGAVAVYAGDDPASLLVAETYLASTRIPELRDRLAELVLAFRRTLARWLAGHGVEDADAVAALLAAAIDGLVLHHRLDPELDVAALAGPVRRLLRKE
ncbi:TetR/AcrR family transcriptional regulator [Nonomuraea wenchangensis]|uniref:TetR/AcrR family transcriptional regulator n=1 Tax=Nonomuraea wenchangensis TaxID=568860 RepID=UPI003334512F